MRIIMPFLVFILISSSVNGQKLTYKGFPSLVWPTLYNITYTAGDKDDFQTPIFTDKVKALEGKTVVLPGYLVPFDNGLTSQTFMLSSLPLNACFFCGVGGPETVVQVIARSSVKYTDKPVEIRGRLVLNDKDSDKMIYILENAEFLGSIEL